MIRAVWPKDRKTQKNWLNNSWLYMAWKVGKDFNQETETVTIQDLESDEQLGSYDVKRKAVIQA